ncbi:MAG: DUF429 domain-containing protein [Chloroflexota bacterium]
MTDGTLLGIDGCKGGWVVARSDLALSTIGFEIVPMLAIGPLLSRAEAACIDIPIGLSDDGPRLADEAARRLLGSPRAASVFPAPCRPTLAAQTYAGACELNRAASGKAVTIYLFNILDRIRAVDDLMTPDLQRRVRECHPEVSFAMLGGTGRGLARPKKSAEGEAERLEILDRWLPRFDLAGVRKTLGNGLVARDDILDAAACLVSAQRAHRRIAMVLPPQPPKDQRGLRMEIVA